MRQHISYIIILLLTSFIVLQLTNNNHVEAQTNFKIGFVDIPEIFSQYSKAKEEKEKVRQQYQQETLTIKKLEEKANKLKEKIPLYRAGSDIRQRLENELAETAFKAKNQSERAKYFMALKLRNGTETVYHDIAKAIEKYAKENGFALILKVEEADFFGAQDPAQVKQKIDMRNVLYWKQALDVTKQVVKLLNK
ncbi:OmpH family outer membrane protein [Candidatus Uabimicrobium sp. HlEnr_7]|uniref:OmpH family outer membrane protein n=1 Tax=Candidatus Uabimicrobium helgolandensis TaxID=3095367 RepID=UPI003555C101